MLHEAYKRTRKNAAPGLDGVTAADYKKELNANLINLHQRLKSGEYKAPCIKRIWLDKDDGKKRPIGISVFEDKLVQRAAAMLLGAVHEQDFHDLSYGFREGRNAHQALAKLRERLMGNGIKWVVDADISGFFDNY